MLLSTRSPSLCVICPGFCAPTVMWPAKLPTLTSPPSGAAYEPRKATTCVPSVAHRLGVTERPFGACSARTSPIFPSFHSFVKLAAHA